jgi:hypothetical protein
MLAIVTPATLRGITWRPATPTFPPGDFAVTPNYPSPTDLIWRLIELKSLVEDQMAAQYLSAALKRLTILRDDALIRGR